MESILIGKNVKFPRQFSLIEYFEKRLSWGAKNGGANLINPENIALIQNERTLKFKDLSRDSSIFSQVLKDYIIREDLVEANEDGDYLIGICMSPSIELILALFGILKLGIGYVPFDSAHPEERIIHMLETSKPWFVITDSDNEKILEKVKCGSKIVHIEDIMRKVEELKMKFNNDSGEKFNEEIEFLPSSKYYANENSERIAALLYTSGSTGLPKGTRLSHKAAMNRIYWNWTEFPFRDYKLESNFLKTTLTFVDSIWEVFGPLLYGCSLNLYPREQTTQAGPLLEKIQQDSITRIFLSPLLLRTIFDTITLIGEEKGQKMLQSVYFVSSTSEILTAHHVEEFYRYFPKDCVIANFYGSTEVFDVAYQVIRNKDDLRQIAVDGKIPIGGPIYNTAIYLLDDNLNLIKSGQVGEIYVTGANLASGYSGIKNSDKFLKNPFSEYKDTFGTLYKTGDFGSIESTPNGDSVLMYNGRMDTQIKVRGFRADLNEIERIISSSILIHKCVVLCYKRAEPGQKIIAFIEKNGDNVENSEMLQMFQEKLREFEIPELKVVQKIPILMNDKTDRQKLLKDYEVDKINGNSFEDWKSLAIDPKKIDACSTLVKIVSQLGGLCLKEVAENFDSSFYSLGGNSLNSLEAIAHLRNHSYFIEIGKFVSAQSLREISNLMEYRKEKIKTEIITPITVQKNPNYTFEDLNETHREEAIKNLAEGFSIKGDLEKYNKISVEDYYTLIDSFWDFVSEIGYSFILRRNSDQKIVGVNLLTDYFNEPEEMIVSSQELKHDLEFQHFLEAPQISKLGNGKGELMHAFLMTTSLDLVASENVIVMELMSEKIIEKGREFGFNGILACDTNPLSQQLAQIHGWKTLEEFQINQFITQDGHKPFQDAQDFVKVHVNYKKL